MVKRIEKRGYDQDFYAWTMHTVELLKHGKLSELDIEHLAEEIESVGKSEKRELINRLSILMVHLLKWQFQATRRSKSWKLTIKNQRLELEDHLAESPSLKKEMASHFDRAYTRAVIKAAAETGLDEQEFSPHSPFSIEDCFNADYFPT